MGLSSFQRAILWMAAMVAAVMVFYPPVGRPAEYGHLYSEGYRPIYSVESRQVINYRQLWTQLAVLFLFGAAAFASGARVRVCSNWKFAVGILCIMIAVGMSIQMFLTVPIAWEGDNVSGWIRRNELEVATAVGASRVEMLEIAEGIVATLLVTGGIVLLRSARQKS